MGIEQWSQNVQVQANPGKRMRLVTLSATDVILAGGSLYIDMYAPAGYISTVQHLTFTYPAVVGAVSGTLTAYLIFGVATLYATTLNQSKALVFNYGKFGPPSVMDLATHFSVWSPIDQCAMNMAQRGTFDEVLPARIRFMNDTNASDGGSIKNINLWVMDEKIGG